MTGFEPWTSLPTEVQPLPKKFHVLINTQYGSEWKKEL